MCSLGCILVLEHRSMSRPDWLARLSADSSFHNRKGKILVQDINSRLSGGESPKTILKRLKSTLGVSIGEDHSAVAIKGWKWHHTANGENEATGISSSLKPETVAAIQACHKRRRSQAPTSIVSSTSTISVASAKVGLQQDAKRRKQTDNVLISV